MKTIVILTDCIENIYGGAEKQIFHLAQGLNQRGYRVIIVSLECEGVAPVDVIRSSGGEMIPLPVARIYGMSGLIQGRRFLNLLKEWETDVLVSFHFSSDIWGTLLARLAGIHTVISSRRDMGFWRSQRHIWLYRLINRYVDYVVTVSESIKQLFIHQEGISDSKVKVIYNGVHLPDLLALRQQTDILRKEFHLEKHHKIILAVGYCVPIKGYPLLLGAFSMLHLRFPEAKLVIAGDGPLLEKLRLMVREKRMEGAVIFAGQRRDIDVMISMSDICVLGSESEGLSNAIMEYMAGSRPVVATSVGGNPELVDQKKTGLLVPYGDSLQMAEALAILLESPDLCKEYGRAGRLKMEQSFTMDQMVDDYCRLWEC